MAKDETVATASIELRADGSKLAPEMAVATVKAQGTLDRANKLARSDKNLARTGHPTLDISKYPSISEGHKLS